VYSRILHPVAAVDPALLTQDKTTVGIIGDPVAAVAHGSRVVHPTSTYIYDEITHLWVPQVAGPGGTVVEFNSARIADFLSSLLTCCDGNGDELRKVASLIDAVAKAGVTLFDSKTAQLVAAVLGFRKVVGIDAGAYTAPAAGAVTVDFTGVNLDGRTLFLYNADEQRFHRIISVADPVGVNPGVLTLDPPVQAATPELWIPYADVPHGYETLSDANRVRRVDPEWAHYRDPIQEIAVTGVTEALGAYDTTVNVVDYRRATVQVDWDAGAGETYATDLHARAFPGANLEPVNAWFRVASSVGSALGVAAQTGQLLATLVDEMRFYELVIRRTKGGGAANNDTFNGYIILG